MGSDFTPAITGPSYLSFLMTVILGLALMFELPLVIVFLARVGLVTPRFLMRNFRWAVLVIFVAAAIITPTSDVFNLCLFAVPTLLLYLLGVAAAALVGRAKTRAEAAAEAELEDGGGERGLVVTSSACSRKRLMRCCKCSMCSCTSCSTTPAVTVAAAA